ncbi:hypothetical protein GCM10007874_34790 [Labrys miyagiensis]|uniref:Glycerophosphoryl diester phosphodiesterase membrane domain-containing protein n=1 Tax=Labrys miyagiensis TaxID=346912 RepID=A0ABQ6CJD1_9HYPH|nr:hypothetical protein [Labrys miyagiensis]GLS20462.1 hypothetical protein GCM10007874_34790 [Labrys miyagiensis]
MVDTPVLVPGFRIGSVAASAGQICLRSLPWLLVLNALPSLPALLILVLTGDSAQSASMAYLISLPISIILVIFAQGATILGTFRLLQGESFGLIISARAAWWTLPVLTGTGLLVGVIVMLGFAALFVPGLMAICVLYVTLPACIVERTGLVESLQRSAELTDGYRWPLFGLFLLTALPVMGLSALTDGLDDGSSPLVGMLGQEAATLLYSAVTAVLTTICFDHLRRVKGSFVMLH